MAQLNDANRIQQLIKHLDLKAHPEGGYFRESYRSIAMLDSTEKNLATSIYFLLTYDNPSRFHRISSDELWFFHEGSSLTVHTLSNSGHQKLKLGLGVEQGELPYQLVKGGTIFGSTVDTKDGYALVSCVVAPGFDFSDFELFETQDLHDQFPQHGEIIKKLT